MKGKINDLNKIKATLLIAVFILSTIALAIPFAIAEATISTPADAEINADTYISQAWIALPNLVIDESAFGEISNGTIIFNAPAGFEFMTLENVSVASSNITFADNDVNATSSTITFEVTHQSMDAPDQITFTNIQVLPTTGTMPNFGNITRTGTSTGLPTPGNYGNLTMVPGAAFNLTVEGIKDPFEGGTDSGVTVTALDQFGNIATGETGKVNFTSTDVGLDTVLPANTSLVAGIYVFNGTTIEQIVTLTTYGEQNVTVIYNNDPDINGSQTGITVVAEFDVTVSPSYIKAGSYWFEVSVENNASSLALNVVNITYPGEPWTLNNIEPPQGWLLTGTDEYTATGGYELNIGESAIFKFNMTTDIDGNFTVAVENIILETYYPKQNCSIDVDEQAPGITLVHPAGTELINGYSFGAGNKIWINATVFDDYAYTPVMYINVTGFDYTINLNSTAADYTWDVCFYSDSVTDGPLAFYINATDGAGNVGTEASSVEIDNTPPEIIDIVVYDSLGDPLPEPTPGTFYISEGETAISVNVTVYDPNLDQTNSKVYFNTTFKYAITTTTNNTLNGPYSVENVDYLVINATTFDTAFPEANSYNMTIEVLRDIAGPSVVGFTDVEEICGGLIVRGLYSDDNVGTLDYVFSMNGTYEANVTVVDLESTVWTAAGGFNGTVVLNLVAYAGDLVNITVVARDYGLNPSNETIVYEGIVPDGMWIPVQLYEGYNLVSLPLIPDSPAREDILSLILDQGASAVTITYEYNQNSDAWIMNPDEMTDGWGYWLYLNEYDVMIVEGAETLPAPGNPATYEYTEGWVLGGYKEIETGTDYFGSFVADSYLEYAYVYNAAQLAWTMLPTGDPVGLEPGQGFWIWMHENQYLIPPIRTP